MSLAAATREAVRRRPFLLAALRAGVVNYTAAARYLDDELGDDTDAIATALRRFAEELPDDATGGRDARVAMESGLGAVDASDAEAVLAVGAAAFAPGAGSLTGVIATGDVDAAALAHVLSRLETADVSVVAAAVGGESLAVVVERRDGADALRVVEAALERVPE